MLNMVFSYFLNGIGKIKIQVYTSIFGFLINIPLSIFLAKNMGLGSSGVIYATNITVFIFLIFRIIQYKKIISGEASGVWNA